MDERKIVWAHARALGDCLMMTAGIRDFKILFPHCRINVHSNFPDLWLNNPYLDIDVKVGGENVEYYKVGYPLINNSNGTFCSFHFAFLMDMICQADAAEPLGMSISEFCSSFSRGRAGDGNPTLHELPDGVEPFLSYRTKFKEVSDQLYANRGDIHLSEEEKKINIVEGVYGLNKPYWVIAPGGKRDCTAKIWDWRRFQKVIDHFENKIKFVSIGTSNHLIENLDGVLSLVDKLSFREILYLINHSDGCVSTVSFLMHASAALPISVKNDRGSVTLRTRPCVSIYGGREPVSFTGYEGHQILHTAGIFDCCDNGGCWQSRVIPINKGSKDDDDCNKRLCHHTVQRDSKTIQACMDVITATDIIRSIEKYYEGSIYAYNNKPVPTNSVQLNDISSKDEILITPVIPSQVCNKEINVLASLASQGGGEQSILMIVRLLREAGWVVNLYPWDKVDSSYVRIPLESSRFKGDMAKVMKPGLPLLFYANDNIGDFCNPDFSHSIVENSSCIIIGINYINDKLPKSPWLAKKVAGIIFQNEEKLQEFTKVAVGFETTKLISLYGAIDLNKFLEIPVSKRTQNGNLIVVRHSMPDFRKFVTRDSKGKGEKPHIWQKHFDKTLDTDFYSRLLKDTKNTEFHFMAAHPEIVDHFKSNDRIVFYSWDQIPVEDLLSKAHVYLYRTSNLWRDQYPRVVAEALAAGLPVIGEPRDGTYDRIVYGDTGFFSIDYDGFLYHLKLLQRKEDYRFAVGTRAKAWAKVNLDPANWIRLISDLCGI